MVLITGAIVLQCVSLPTIILHGITYYCTHCIEQPAGLVEYKHYQKCRYIFGNLIKKMNFCKFSLYNTCIYLFISFIVLAFILLPWLISISSLHTYVSSSQSK